MIVGLRRKLIYHILFCVACCLMACDTDFKGFFQSAPDLSDVHVVSPLYKTHPDSIRTYIGKLLANDRDTLAVDAYCRKYYTEKRPFLWLNYAGIEPQTDTLRAILDDVQSIGFNTSAFYVDRISKQLENLLPGKIDSLHTNATEALANFEYFLTKAYFRYAAGLHYGFVSPQYTYNHLDRDNQGNASRPYRRLMELPLEQPTRKFFDEAVSHVYQCDVPSYLESLAPQDDYYRLLLERLQVDTLSAKARQKVIANMERARWRIKNDPRQKSKYVFVNIPEFMLHAIDESRVLSMKMGCGAYATKTPLLISSIKRIDLNPKWVIPHSILKSEVAHHLGDSGWFARRRYVIRDHSTGKVCNPRSVSSAQLLSGHFSVAQEGGNGNALGRIIFRFDNPFAVYIHHTSNPAFFAQSNRAVSHGCVRVEQPYDLAEFVLGPGHESTMERIRYSTSLNVSPTGGNASSGSGSPKMISSQTVSPQVPLYIGYYTYYPSSYRTDKAQQLLEFPDVYGYDRVLVDKLKRDGYLRVNE